RRNTPTGRPDHALGMVVLGETRGGPLGLAPVRRGGAGGRAGHPDLDRRLPPPPPEIGGDAQARPEPPRHGHLQEITPSHADPPLVLDGEASLSQDWVTPRIDGPSPNSRHSFRQDSPPSSLR